MGKAVETEDEDGISEGVIFKNITTRDREIIPPNSFLSRKYFVVIYTDTLLIIRLKPQYSGVFSLSLTKNITFLDLLSALISREIPAICSLNIHATFALRGCLRFSVC